ncbi:MAG: hypothetical protein ACREU6_10875, partial [Steroidobacteraceae bacterium]
MTLPRINLDVHTHLIPVDAAHTGRFPGVVWDPVGQRLSLDGDVISLRALFHPEMLVEWLEFNN